MIALGFGVLMFGLSYHTTPSFTSSETTCIGTLPCSGEFTGIYQTGYSTYGCIPLSASEGCFVPQIATMTGYLNINNASFVIDWANRTFQVNNQLTDGATVSVSGSLSPIFYNKTLGATFLIYRLGTGSVMSPQPEFEIQNATLMESINSTCTATLTFTVSGSPNGVWNLPMIPSEDCYTIMNSTPPSYSTNVSTSIQTILLASSASGILLMCLGLLFLNRSRSKSYSDHRQEK